MAKTLGVSLVAVAVGYAVVCLLSLGAGALSDVFALTNEQLIDNAPRVLANHATTILIVGIGGFLVAVALGASAASWLAAWLLLCLMLAAIWPACAYVGHRVRVRRNAA